MIRILFLFFSQAVNCEFSISKYTLNLTRSFILYYAVIILSHGFVRFVRITKYLSQHSELCWPGGPPGTTRCAFGKIRLLRPNHLHLCLSGWTIFSFFHCSLFGSHIIPDSESEDAYYTYHSSRS